MKTVCKQFLTLALVLTMLFSPALPGLSVDLKASAFDRKSFTVTKTLNDAFSAENSGNGGISLFSVSPSYDSCFGNQLEAEAKEIYDHFVSTYAVNRQAGELTYTFSSPFTFHTAIENGNFVENEDYQEICETISVAFQSAMDAFLYDYPDVFWFRSGSYSFGISFSGSSDSNMNGTISSAVFTPAEIYSGASSKISSYDDKVSEAVNTIRSAVGTDADGMSVLKYVHDYICNHAYYNLTDEAKVHSSEPFFIGDGGVVCEGYAKTFKVLCDKLSLPCACVSGTAKTSDGKNEAHMWNLVQMEDGKWYLVDVTWDDQTSKIYDTYFLAGATSAGFNDIISKERTESTDFSSTGWKNFVYPVLSSDKYTPHVHSWNAFYTVDTAATCTNAGSKSIHCSLCSAQKDITPVPALEHDYSIVEGTAKAPACTTDGKDADKKCSRCNEIVTGIRIPATGHVSDKGTVTENPTCAADGTKEYKCTACGATVKTETLGKNAHTYTNKVTPATIAKDGKIVTACTICGEVSQTVVIAKIASISLSADSYTYDGKVKTPTVTVKDSKKKTLKLNTDYTVTYAPGRKTSGQYAVKITFKGNYSKSKTLYFTILPGVTSKIAATASSSAIRLTWKAVPGATGYRVYRYDAKAKKYVTLKTTTRTSCTVSKLKSGTKYKFAVKAYSTVNGKVYWASGYKTVTATTNPGTPTLKVTAGTKKATLSWNKQTGATGYVVYMATSKNGKYSKIATLKGNSKVSYTKTGLTKGKTYYFKVAAYTVANGKTLYSSFSSVKAVKIK